MSISIRSRFILISVSITVLALILFSSVMYDRAIQYKHEQEKKSYAVLTEQLINLLSSVEDLTLIKKSLSEDISSKIQPAQVFAIVNEQRNVLFHYSKHDVKENTFENLLPVINQNKAINEGSINENNRSYYWSLNKLTGYTNKKYSVLTIYPLSSSIASEFLKFFGLPFFISGFLLCWIMVWASIILSSLVIKLQNQKQILSDQAVDIEKSRDQALHANLAKTNFLANMSHEIRTPLTSIIGFAESCLDIEQSMKERSKATEIIIRSGKHLLNIINEILDLSKIEIGKLEIEKISVSIVDMLDEIKQLVSIMAEEKGLNFEINYTYPLPEKIVSDPLRLKQILINLCSNAIKFTESGHVYLNISYTPESSSLIFEVVDTGIGMTAEQTKKIFKPFEQADSSTTRKYGGTGLGLTLSKQLVEMLNGNIKVESIVNKGSRFIVSLEIEEVDNFHYIYADKNKDIIQKQNEVNIETPILEGKVLLAEDNEDIRGLVKLLLRKTGATLDSVENGQQAVYAATEYEYDLVLLDIQMPVMDGITAMKELKYFKYNRPVVAMTANAMQKDREDCKKAGFSGFIGKPINRNELYLVLKQYLKPGNTNKSESEMLTSSLLEDDPELIDLIDKFIGRLPAMRDAINKAHSENNEEELSSLVHQMKGVGGNYGYPTLTELSAKIEFQITSKHTENIAALIEEFNQMVDQIIQGHDENHKIASQ